ncbi:MAG: ribonuclease HII [Acholeplasmatales bacterium]|jgi:ribonuclease HII|nr:ribonuclease HII [Acholeplasmatales bacterium]
MILKDEFEKKGYLNGAKYIAGVDEVGRGPLAGPVVVCAVVLVENPEFSIIDDSKKLTKKQREKSFYEILKNTISFSISFVGPEVIDNINILEATRKGAMEAINNLSIKPDLVLLDALKLDLDIPSISIIKGDSLSYSISAASIIAKKVRDDYMHLMDKVYPNYDFINNVGYGTKKHTEKIFELGICPIHRKSFEPIKSLVKK